MLVSEPIEVDIDSMRAGNAAPACPDRFRWHGVDYRVERVVETWKSFSPKKRGHAGRYVRRHYFEVVTGAGTMTLYCLRSPEPGRPAWFLYSSDEM